MNPKCYIITFHLSPSRDNSALIDAIKAYGVWAKITSTTWAIVTTDLAKEVRNNLDTHLTQTDRLFVVKSGYEAAWKNVECSSEWLKKNL